MNKDKEDLLYQIFFEVDNFVKSYDAYAQHQNTGQPRNGLPGRIPSLSMSEKMTILIFYHQSGFRCFQYYYEQLVMVQLRSFFPKIVSYQHFVSMIGQCSQLLFMYAHYTCSLSRHTGIYFADSKKLPVCDNIRIPSNKVFSGVAGRGKSSTGWFYGLKLHLIINNLGEINNFVITPANFADNDKKVLDVLFDGVKGKCFADKGYLTKFFEEFYEKGIQLIAKIRKNMKNTIMKFNDKCWSKKRAVIESVNDLLMSVFDIDHTRHRNPWNAITHIIAGVAAYSFYPEKPSVFIVKLW
jgi:hypothetical protein